MSEKVKFETNIWQEVALRYPDGKNLQNEYGPSVMFSTIDNRVIFLPVPAAEKVRALKLAPGARIDIRKAEVNGANGTKPHIEWQVKRVDAPGEQGQPSQPAPATEVGPSRVNPTTERPKTRLEDALKTVVAACHAARSYAKEIGYEAMPQFTGEDLRCMANTLIIQASGGGR